MSAPARTVEEWKKRNSHRLIECRWNSVITREACVAYQSRSPRYVLHFNGDGEPVPGVNAEYIRCFHPDPCPHVIPDAEARELRAEREGIAPAAEEKRRRRVNSERMRSNLVNQNLMLDEPDWHRSLVKRRH